MVRLRSVVPDTPTCWHHDFRQTVQPSGRTSTRNLLEGLHQPRLEVFHGGYPVKQHLMLIRMANWCSKNLRLGSFVDLRKNSSNLREKGKARTSCGGSSTGWEGTLFCTLAHITTVLHRRTTSGGCPPDTETATTERKGIAAGGVRLVEAITNGERQIE